MLQLFIKFLFLFIIVVVFATGANTTDDTFCDGTGWIAFRDEKCFKLVKKWATVTDAKAICAQESFLNDSSIPQLVSIKSSGEQNFLTDYIFNTSGVEINVWTGAKRVPNSSNQFVWDDGSSMEYYTNWAEGSPTEDSKSSCMGMKSRAVESQKLFNEIGKWLDISCETPSYVICEKLPRWSFGKLQEVLLEQRRKQLITETELTVTKSELSQTRNRLANVEDNPVPIGFIYVQLPNQSEPQTLWPAIQWENVTSEYAGLFFRAEGGGAAQFGTVQTENAPRVTEVVFHWYGGDQGNKWIRTNLTPGAWSSGIGVFAGSWDAKSAHTHRFFQSGGEVRPKNMAMRLWKRIN